MSEGWRIGGRYAAAATSAALVTATFHVPQPFLGVLVAFLLVSAKSLPHERIFLRLVGAVIGIVTGVLLLVTFPQQPWLLLPIFAVIVAAGLYYSSLTKDDSVVLSTLVALVAGVPTTILSPNLAVFGALTHGINVIIGILCAAFAFLLFPAKEVFSKDTIEIYSFSRALSVGITVVLGMVFAAIFLPTGAAILVIASAIMAFRLFESSVPSFITQKMMGAVVGVILAILFNIIIVGAADNITLFLIILGLFFVAAGWVGHWKPGICPCLLQGTAMFAVAAPCLPEPQTSFVAMMGRVEDVIVGCVAGIIVYKFHVWTEHWKSISAPEYSKPASK
ncbi:MAG: FUSC family protein [Chthoniobacterales bacterium]